MNENISPQNRRILVTGGAGFIGSHLARKLLPDNEVIVLDDLSTGIQDRIPEGAQFINGDIRNEAMLEKIGSVDIVFHEAALVDVNRSIERPMASHSRTASGTLSILEYGRRSDARVVVASSAAIYGNPSTIPIEESAPKNPRSPYGVDKLAADHYGRLYAKLYGLETVVLRYFNVFGPGQGSGQYSGVISTFFDQAQSGGPLTVHGDGKQTRDFIYIDDVVRANLHASRTTHTGQAFNVGTGDPTTINGLANEIVSVTDSMTDIKHVETREGDIRRSTADIDRLIRDLNFRPQVSLRSGLETMWENQARGQIRESRG